MTQLKQLSLNAAFGLALGLFGLVGCSRTEPSATPQAAAEQKPPAMDATSGKAGELPPISPELRALVSSNRAEEVHDQVYWITNSSFASVQKAQALMELLPTVDRDGQRAVAHAATKYIADSNHTLVSKPLLEGKLDPQILSIFMTDTLKRPDPIRMPVLTALSAMDDHFMREEARDLLAAFSKQHVADTSTVDQASQKQVAN